MPIRKLIWHFTFLTHKENPDSKVIGIFRRSKRQKCRLLAVVWHFAVIKRAGG